MSGPAVPPPITCHALRHGLALCGFPDRQNPKVPSAWPEDHRWVYTHDRDAITCVSCRAALGLPLTPGEKVSLPHEPPKKESPAK